MSSTAYRQLSSFSASLPRWMDAYGLRRLARIVLVSWLFTLMVCYFGEVDRSMIHHARDASLAQHHHGHSGHDAGEQDEDSCCTLQQNAPTLANAGDIQIPPLSLVSVLLPYVFAFHAVPLITAKARFFCTDPPGKAGPALIANCLWPNAPPR